MEQREKSSRLSSTSPAVDSRTPRKEDVVRPPQPSTDSIISSIGRVPLSVSSLEHREKSPVSYSAVDFRRLREEVEEIVLPLPTYSIIPSMSRLPPVSSLEQIEKSPRSSPMTPPAVNFSRTPWQEDEERASAPPTDSTIPSIGKMLPVSSQTKY